MLRSAYRFGRDTINTFYELGKNTIGAAKKSVYDNSIYVYWWNKEKNFGDLITPYLFNAYGFKAVHKSINDAEVISTGSILQRLTGNKFQGIILGSGIIKDEDKPFPNATILAVRGSYTANRIKAPSSVVLADPGILISELLENRQKKKYKLGIIPHFQDKNHRAVRNFQKNNNHDVLFIDVQNSPRYVVNEVDKCEFIMSSSLHGLITADSLGIPNIRFKTSKNASGGGDFKFEDYNTSISRENYCHRITGGENIHDIIQKTNIMPNEIQHCKNSMTDAIIKMKSILFAEDKAVKGV